MRGGSPEGISYLAVLGIVAWSAATKARTGSGLPPGPAGLLGAVEGVSYLSLLGGELLLPRTARAHAHACCASL